MVLLCCLIRQEEKTDDRKSKHTVQMHSLATLWKYFIYESKVRMNMLSMICFFLVYAHTGAFLSFYHLTSLNMYHISIGLCAENPSLKWRYYTIHTYKYASMRLSLRDDWRWYKVNKVNYAFEFCTHFHVVVTFCHTCSSFFQVT